MAVAATPLPRFIAVATVAATEAAVATTAATAAAAASAAVGAVAAAVDDAPPPMHYNRNAQGMPTWRHHCY